MARDREHVERDTRSVAADVPPTIVDPRIDKAEEGGLDEPARAERHHARVLVRHPKLQVVEQVDILEKGAGVGSNLTEAASDQPAGSETSVLALREPGYTSKQELVLTCGY